MRDCVPPLKKVGERRSPAFPLHYTTDCIVLYCIVLYCIVLYCIVLYCMFQGLFFRLTVLSFVLRFYPSFVLSLILTVTLSLLRSFSFLRSFFAPSFIPSIVHNSLKAPIKHSRCFAQTKRTSSVRATSRRYINSQWRQCLSRTQRVNFRVDSRILWHSRVRA